MVSIVRLESASTTSGGQGPTEPRVELAEASHGTPFRFLRLQRIAWRDAAGRARTYECVERRARKGGLDAVVCATLVLSRTQPLRVVLVVQFRPPIHGYCLEMPAGMVDAGESPEQAALRELREETGFAGGRVLEACAPTVTDPGLTNAACRFVYVCVNEDAPENSPEQRQQRRRQQDREQIQVLLLPWVGLWRHLQELQQRHGWHVDSRLQAYAAGMLHARVLAVLAASGGSEGLPDVLNDPHFQVLSKL